MKPAAFDYKSPSSLDELLDIKAEHGDEAKPLAGGQSLIPAMNFRIAQPTLLVDLNNVKDLDNIGQDKGELSIGAMVRQGEVETSKLVKKYSPLLYELMPNIAHSQIRNRGTIGGSLVHSDPAAELPVAAITLDARFKAKSKSAERWIEAKDFFDGMFTVSLSPEEILTEVVFPKFPNNTGWSFMEIARRQGDYAMAGVAALVTLDDKGECKESRLVYLNVGDGPVDAVKAASSLKGKTLTYKSIETAAMIASNDEISPFGSMHASVEFQQHLSSVLTKRALSKANERAKKAIAK